MIIGQSAHSIQDLHPRTTQLFSYVHLARESRRLLGKDGGRLRVFGIGQSDRSSASSSIPLRIAGMNELIGVFEQTLSELTKT